MKFTVDFNKREKCTEDQYNKLKSINGVTFDKDGYFYYVELEDFSEMRVFEDKIDDVFDYKLSMIVSLDEITGYIFLTEE